MYDTKIDIHVPVRNYYSDAVRGVKCIKEMGKSCHWIHLFCNLIWRYFKHFSANKELEKKE